MTKLIRIFALTLALSACGTQNSAPPERPPLEGAAIGGPFTLTGKDGNVVRWQDFDGQYRIVYFGYTFCPDACPLDLQVMFKGLAQFEKAQPALARHIQPIFISIDPERDTPAAIGEFTAAFSPRLIGLTGTPDQIKATAKSFAAPYAKGKETSGGYLMDHPRIAYLMGPKGEPIATLPVEKQPPSVGAKAVAAELAKWVR